jgi:uncharacterized membrane-anchored protein
MTRTTKFYIIIILQIVLLFAMIGTKIYTLKTGTKILLEVLPVDPRDLFRGEYVRLQYKISTINWNKMEKIEQNQMV